MAYVAKELVILRQLTYRESAVALVQESMAYDERIFRDIRRRPLERGGMRLLTRLDTAVDLDASSQTPRRRTTGAAGRVAAGMRKLRIEAEKKHVEDRTSDREMYLHDSTLRSDSHTYALTMFTCFMVAQKYLVWQVMQNGLEISEFVLMTFSNFGVFTAILFTLKDFLFGGSENSMPQTVATAEVVKSELDMP
jgi:hypothetical protein